MMRWQRISTLCWHYVGDTRVQHRIRPDLLHLGVQISGSAGIELNSITAVMCHTIDVIELTSADKCTDTEARL